MKIPIFVRGTKENIYKAIQDGDIKYPAYIWEKQSGEWWFLNENNIVEKGTSHMPVTGIVGTLENPIIISELEDDGLYAIKGVYKIANLEEATLYSSNSFVLFVLRTVDNVKKIKRIAEDSIQDFTVSSEEITEDTYVTEHYLDSKGYVNQETMDEKIDEVEQELQQYIDEQITDKVDTIVEEKIDENIQPVPDSNIEGLFDNN